MRILKIIHGYPPDYNAGSEVYSQSICEELSRKHQVFIFTREENPYLAPYQLRQETLNPHLQKFVVNKTIDKDTYQHDLLDARLEQVLDICAPDIAHIGHLNHLSTGLVEVLEKRKIPIVFTLHDYWLMCPRGQFLRRDTETPADFYTLCDKQTDAVCARACYGCYFSGTPADRERDIAYWTDWVATRMQTTGTLASKVAMFLAPARYLRDRFVRDFGISPERIQYLDYGFPPAYLQSPKPAQARSVFTFGYIGTHIPAKGIKLLIEAFSQLQAPARLLIWGRENGQSSRYLRKLAETSPNPISFRGEYVNKNLALEVFAQVDAIVVPSIWAENSPLVIHEAQACQIPVITANFGGMSEYVQDHENGLLFEHRNSESLHEQLAYAVNHPDLLARLGKRGYLYSENGQVPSIEAHCASLEEVYARLLTPTKTNYAAPAPIQSQP